MRSNVRDNVLFSSPKDEVERAYVAGACVRKLGIKFPALVDGFDNRVESAYTGWPDRLYLIGQGRSRSLQEQARPLRLSPGRSGTGHQNIAPNYLNIAAYKTLKIWLFQIHA